MVRSKRAHDNPLVGVSCVKVTQADQRRRRRNLSNAEVTALIQTARRSPHAFKRLSGPDRAMLYLVAVNTGLRASELGSLTPESFELASDQPLVRCLPGYTKNGSEAVLPIKRDLAGQLRSWLTDKPAGQPVWPGRWAKNRHGAAMMRMDLANADVDYADSTDRVADFHALRHTFISNLARAGVHPSNAQALARHSTIDLTMNVYTHVGIEELASNVESLPAIVSQPTSLYTTAETSKKSGCPAAAPTTSGSTSSAAAPATSDSISPATVNGASTATSPAAMPQELASLASSWADLPEPIRRAITALAGA